MHQNHYFENMVQDQLHASNLVESLSMLVVFLKKTIVQTKELWHQKQSFLLHNRGDAVKYYCRLQTRQLLCYSPLKLTLMKRSLHFCRLHCKKEQPPKDSFIFLIFCACFGVSSSSWPSINSLTKILVDATSPYTSFFFKKDAST